MIRTEGPNPDTLLNRLDRPWTSLSFGAWRWRGQDSNLRRQSQRVYSASPLTAREPRRGLVSLGPSPRLRGPQARACFS